MAKTLVSPEILNQIERAIGSIDFGTVQITVHNARVVQIDKMEKIRLPREVERPEAADSLRENAPTDRSPGGVRRKIGL